MTTTPTPAPAPDAPGADLTTAADHVLAERCANSGQYIAGLIAAGMLDAVGTPRQLPRYLFPDVDPAVAQEIFDRGAATGYRAAMLAANPQWTREGIDRLRAALRDAGYSAMGASADRTANTLRPLDHPADTDQGTDTARGEHW
ncbi:hypothetical protein [Streptomyces sp. Wb2n-11]|uniref:hypothetical protein n=1 Tax=Streptomyces sp. Wb2n-11 TaxID=1030533 RepID=UPI000ABB04C1|nr:hypothetical protein [Streptomyces sp. Wb2n-11]